MIAQLTDALLYRFTWYEVTGLTIAWFLFLYFGVGSLFAVACRVLHRKGLVHRIVPGQPSPAQTRYEITHSLLSIILFGFSALPLVWLVRSGYLSLPQDTIWSIALGLAVLTVWNEAHFFLVHRLMHQPWWMRNVHRVHHRSRIPTTWSVFSFHPAEAFLLSTVPLTIVPFIPLAPMAIILFPLVSILLNFAGHSNYRFGKGSGPSWKAFSTRHSGHHAGTHTGYGFASPLPDRLWRRVFHKTN